VTAITVSFLAAVQDRAHQTTGPAIPGRWEPIMTSAFKSLFAKASIAMAFAAVVSALSSTASFAFSAEAQQMCTGDAFRLCSSDIPNIPKITACMIKHRTQLSSGCRVVLDRDLAAQRRASAD
jgi:hypothetical protein